MWAGSLWLLLDFWPLWLVAFVLFVIYNCSSHTKRTAKDGLSPFSVFNPGVVRLHGELSAEELQAQMTGMILPARPREDIDAAMDRQAAAQEEVQLREALEKSMREM